MHRPVDVKRDSVKTVGLDFLKNVAPDIRISRKPPGVEFCRKNEDSLPLDRQRMRVPSDCISKSGGVAFGNRCQRGLDRSDAEGKKPHSVKDYHGVQFLKMLATDRLYSV